MTEFSDTYKAEIEGLAQLYGVRRLVWTNSPRDARMFENGEMRTPFPVVPADLACAYHEIAHAALEPDAKQEHWPPWKAEVRASSLALGWYEVEFAGKDLRDGADLLARYLLPYLEDACERSVATPDEITAEVRSERRRLSLDHDLIADPERLTAARAAGRNGHNDHVGHIDWTLPTQWGPAY